MPTAASSRATPAKIPRRSIVKRERERESERGWSIVATAAMGSSGSIFCISPRAVDASASGSTEVRTRTVIAE